MRQPVSVKLGKLWKVLKPHVESVLQKVTRDLILFTTGLFLTVNEAFRAGPERPAILTLYASMMGLPIVLRAQDKKNEAAKSAPPSEPEEQEVTK